MTDLGEGLGKIRNLRSLHGNDDLSTPPPSSHDSEVMLNCDISDTLPAAEVQSDVSATG